MSPRSGSLVTAKSLYGVPVEIFETLANWSSTSANRVSSRAEHDLAVTGCGNAL